MSGDLSAFAADQNLRLARKMLEQQGEINDLKAQRDKLLALCDAADSPEVEVARSIIHTDDIRAIYAESASDGAS